MTDLYYPLRSLREGHWFKLICGASFQHLPAVQNLVLAYTLAGADCIDVAADPAVISTAKLALATAAGLAESAKRRGFGYRGLPWLMVSLNDGEDPHFRKAEFRAADCPADCPRPCEKICPAQAIIFHDVPVRSKTANSVQAVPFDHQPPSLGIQPSFIATPSEHFSGVISDRCYGCGRCLPVCPIQHILTRSYVSTPAAIAPLVLQAGVDAIEIHTQIGRLEDFRRVWQAILPWVHTLKLVAISCPDGEGLIDYLWALYDLISPLPCPLIWQTDGRPMSGDIGIGATRAAVKLGQKVLAAGLPGYVQLAGGTNHHTVAKLKALGLLRPNSQDPSSEVLQIGRSKIERSDKATTQAAATPYVSGVAYGSYARTLMTPILNQLEAMELESGRCEPSLQPFATQAVCTSDDASILQPISSGYESNLSQHLRLEAVPDLLWQAVALAHSLVAPLKSCSIS